MVLSMVLAALGYPFVFSVAKHSKIRNIATYPKKTAEAKYSTVLKKSGKETATLEDTCGSLNRLPCRSLESSVRFAILQLKVYRLAKDFFFTRIVLESSSAT